MEPQRRVDRIHLILLAAGERGLNLGELKKDLKFHKKHIESSFEYLRGLGYNIVEFRPGWWRIDGCLW